MITRVKAIRSTLSLMLTVLQLVFGFHLLTKALGSSGAADWFLNISRRPYGEYRAPFIVPAAAVEAPVKMLFIVLFFMIFSYTMILFIPKMVEKKEKEIRTGNFDIEV